MTNRYNRIVAFVITVALLATCLVIPGFAGAIDEELDVWNGEIVAPAEHR